MNDDFKSVLFIFSGILVVAIVAVIVSKNAQTSNVITDFFNGFANALKAATGPVTG